MAYVAVRLCDVEEVFTERNADYCRGPTCNQVDNIVFKAVTLKLTRPSFGFGRPARCMVPTGQIAWKFVLANTLYV